MKKFRRFKGKKIVIIFIVAVVLIEAIALVSGSNQLKGTWEYSCCYVNGVLTERPYGFEFDCYYTKSITFYMNKTFSIGCKYGYMYGDKMRYANAYDLLGNYVVSDKSLVKLVCDGYEDKTFEYEIKGDELYLHDGGIIFVFEKTDGWY